MYKRQDERCNEVCKDLEITWAWVSIGLNSKGTTKLFWLHMPYDREENYKKVRNQSAGNGLNTRKMWAALCKLLDLRNNK